MEGVRLLHPFGRLGSRRHRAWEKNWPHGTGLHNVKNRSYLRHYATLHGTLQCSPGCKGGTHKLKQRMWKCASNESSRGLRIQYIQYEDRYLLSEIRCCIYFRSVYFCLLDWLFFSGQKSKHHLPKKSFLQGKAVKMHLRIDLECKNWSSLMNQERKKVTNRSKT